MLFCVQRKVDFKQITFLSDFLRKVNFLGDIFP